jgi:C_GCAxxG_C_C family probable redox protein
VTTPTILPIRFLSCFSSLSPVKYGKPDKKLQDMSLRRLYMSEQQTQLKELQEKAVWYFCDRPKNFPAGRPDNCCESILLALAKPVGVDSELIPKLGTAIGAGVSLNGLLCGSISSVMILIGAKYGRTNPEQSPKPVWDMADKYLAAFRERFGAVNCRELTRLDVKTPEGLKEYFASVHDYECAQRLRFAVEKALELL